MTIPTWILLAFALWTLLVLVATVGVYRWRDVLTGTTEIRAFRYDSLEGHRDWYRRGMRAHGNCVENLPVYAAIVVVLNVLNLDTALLDGLAVTLMACRVCQTLVHVSFRETNATVSVRFAFFAAQIVAMTWMAVIAIRAA